MDTEKLTEQASNAGVSQDAGGPQSTTPIVPSGGADRPQPETVEERIAKLEAQVKWLLSNVKLNFPNW